MSHKPHDGNDKGGHRPSRKPEHSKDKSGDKSSQKPDGGKDERGSGGKHDGCGCPPKFDHGLRLIGCGPAPKARVFGVHHLAGGDDNYAKSGDARGGDGRASPDGGAGGKAFNVAFVRQLNGGGRLL